MESIVLWHYLKQFQLSSAYAYIYFRDIITEELMVKREYGGQLSWDGFTTVVKPPTSFYLHCDQSDACFVIARGAPYKLPLTLAEEWAVSVTSY